MIDSEKSLEDYICNHQEKFIAILKTNMKEKDCDIKFLGRQVRLGNDNIADLIYYYEKLTTYEEIEMNERIYIIVELKYRSLEPKDLAQLSRYMNILEKKLQSEEKYQEEYENFVRGVFVSFGENNEMQDISMRGIDNISFISFECDLIFHNDDWDYKEEYLKEINLDDRLEQLFKKE